MSQTTALRQCATVILITYGFRMRQDSSADEAVTGIGLNAAATDDGTKGANGGANEEANGGSPPAGDDGQAGGLTTVFEAGADESPQ